MVVVDEVAVGLVADVRVVEVDVLEAEVREVVDEVVDVVKIVEVDETEDVVVEDVDEVVDVVVEPPAVTTTVPVMKL